MVVSSGSMKSPCLLLLLLLACACSSLCWGFVVRCPLAPLRNTKLFVDGKGMAGGSQHFIGDVLRALQPRYLSQVKDAIAGNAKGPAVVNVSGLVDNAPSWEELQKQCPSPKKDKEQHLAHATERLFGSPEPRVTFYRDSAAWCPYTQKAWIALEEKKVPYVVKKIDMRCYGKGKPDEFLKMQPNGNLPCAVIDGQVIGESDEIIDVIDSLGAPGTPALRPAGSEERLKYLVDDGPYNPLERRLYRRWMWWLTGVRKPEEYKATYLELLDELEDALGETKGPYFLGSDISLADIRFIPFVGRQIASFMYFKGYNIRDPAVRPNICRWLQAMESRPSYQQTKSDYYTHSRALPPQISADCTFEETAEALEIRKMIDGLPEGDALAPQKEWHEPGWDWSAAKQEAAERVLANYENVVKFASRAAGTPGFPAAAAPLADPSSVPNQEAAPAVDLFLRHAINNLLSKRINTKGAKEAATSLYISGGIETVEAVADCMDYLRARIGIPRDMSHPAAQELRAQLKELSATLRSVESETTALGEQATVSTLSS